MNPLTPKLRTRRPRRQDGMALVLVLLVIAVLALLGIAGTRSAQTELQMGQKDVVGRQALGVAEAGINHAYSLISANLASRPNPPSACDTCWGFDSELGSGGTGGALASLGTTATLYGQSYRFRSFGGGTADGYYVQAVDNYDETSGANNSATDRDARIYLVSRGRVGSAERIVTALVTGSSLFPNGVFGNRKVLVSGGATMDGFDSRDGAYSAATAGSIGVRSDGNIDVSGTTTVLKGVPTAGGQVTVGGGATVTGTPINGASTINFPPVPVCGPPYSGSTGISCTPASPPCYTQSTGALTSTANYQTITLEGGTYCFSSITISSHSTLQVSSPVNLYLTGLFDATSGTVVNTTGVASDLKLFDSFVSTYKSNGTPNTNNNQIQLSGGQQTYMAVYAPQAAVAFNGNSNFFGAVVGDYVDDSGGTPVHYDGALVNVLGPGAGLSGWHEVRN